MITSIHLKNFKNFADETLRVGPCTLLVGANASGKSNIRDAFRFLGGIGRGYSLAEIFGGKREAGWQPVRGAMNEIIRFGHTAFSLEVGLEMNGTAFQYSITVRHIPLDGFRVTQEDLTAGSTPIYTAREDSGMLRVEAKGETVLHRGSNPLLARDLLWHTPEPVAIRSLLSTLRFLDLSPERLREPAFPGATVLGDSGEHLPVVVRDICADPKRRQILTSWIAELTPMDVTGFEFPVDPSGRVHLTLCEANGRTVSASSASDGTLRFLALLAVLLGENPGGLYFFEEMDTGIHPARQWLLLDLIEKQAVKRGLQVVTTTHSPDLLTFVNDSTFAHLSVVCRLEDTQDAIIRPVAGLPNAKKLGTSKGGLGRLLAEGWMETALAFTEDYDEAEADGE